MREIVPCLLLMTVVGWVFAPMAAAQTGHQLFVGPAFQGTPPVSVPFAPGVFETSSSTIRVTIFLNRAPDAGTSHPTAMSFDMTWDPSVLSVAGPQSVSSAPLLTSWYGKQISFGLAESGDGILVVSITGGATFLPDTFETVSTQISTFNNQVPVVQPETGTAQQNPFPIATIEFDVVGNVGASTPLGFVDVAMSSQAAQALPTQGAVDGVVIITSDAFPEIPEGVPAASPVAAVFLLGAAGWAAARRMHRRGR